LYLDSDFNVINESTVHLSNGRRRHGTTSFFQPQILILISLVQKAMMEAVRSSERGAAATGLKSKGAVVAPKDAVFAPNANGGSAADAKAAEAPLSSSVSSVVGAERDETVGRAAGFLFELAPASSASSSSVWSSNALPLSSFGDL
jgi:hypothetical protein